MAVAKASVSDHSLAIEIGRLSGEADEAMRYSIGPQNWPVSGLRLKTVHPALLRACIDFRLPHRLA